MKFLFGVLLWAFVSSVFAQHLKVVNAKNAFTEAGLALQENVAVPVDSWVTVKSNGFVIFASNTGWTFKLTEGKHDLNSYYQINKKKYAEHDSVKAIMDAVFPEGISGKTRSVCTTDFHGNFQDLCYGFGNIAFLNCDNNSVIKTQTDTLTISWRDPKYVKGRYFLVFRNMFDEIIDYRISNTNSYKIDLDDLVYDTSYMVTVYSEDRRASYPANIRNVK